MGDVERQHDEVVLQGFDGDLRQRRSPEGGVGPAPGGFQAQDACELRAGEIGIDQSDLQPRPGGAAGQAESERRPPFPPPTAGDGKRFEAVPNRRGNLSASLGEVGLLVLQQLFAKRRPEEAIDLPGRNKRTGNGERDRLRRLRWRNLCSGKDCGSVVVVVPLISSPTQSPAHSFVPLTVPTSLQPVGSFGFN